jgi:hypothetical protein
MGFGQRPLGGLIVFVVAVLLMSAAAAALYPFVAIMVFGSVVYITVVGGAWCHGTCSNLRNRLGLAALAAT